MCTTYSLAKECKLGKTDQLFVTRLTEETWTKSAKPAISLATLVGHKRPSKEQLAVATYLRETSRIIGNIYPRKRGHRDRKNSVIL
jgi:hypothetical protein